MVNNYFKGGADMNKAEFVDKLAEKGKTTIAVLENNREKNATF